MTDFDFDFSTPEDGKQLAKMERLEVVSEDQGLHIVRLEIAFKTLARAIATLAPRSADKSSAFRHIRLAHMEAVWAICYDWPQPEDTSNGGF